jgi:hypothetical protein
LIGYLSFPKEAHEVDIKIPQIVTGLIMKWGLLNKLTIALLNNMNAPKEIQCHADANAIAMRRRRRRDKSLRRNGLRATIRITKTFSLILIWDWVRRCNLNIPKEIQCRAVEIRRRTWGVRDEGQVWDREDPPEFDIDLGLEFYSENDSGFEASG